MTRALLRLMRLYYVLPFSGGLAVIAAYAAGGSPGPHALSLGWGVLALTAVLAGGYVLNDVCDLAVDRVNRPDRPLPRGEISRGAALAWSAGLIAAGLLLAAGAGVPYLGALATVAAVLVLYNVFSKRVGLWKDLWVAALMASLYPLALALVPARPTPRLAVLYLHPVWLFLTAWAYEMLKDALHTAGDRLGSAAGIARISGRPWFLPLARTLLLVAALPLPLPYLLGWCRWVYLGAALGAMALAAGAALATPRRAIPLVYAEVCLVAAGSLADLLIFGP